MPNTTYIEVDLTLDSYDLIVIETLIKGRIKELKEFKASQNGDSIPSYLADEQLLTYNELQRKIKKARAQVKEIKQAADQRYAASRKKQNVAIKQMTPKAN